MGALNRVLGRDIITFRYGRDAIYWGLRQLNVKKGENVLMPASLCDVIIQPFLSLQINIKYYGLNSSLHYNVEEITDKIDDKTRAVYVIHYFGFPQVDIEKVVELCNKRGLFLIEDCAHSFLGQYKGKPLGDYGHISIFSIRKFLPLPDGGYLKMNNFVPSIPVRRSRNPLYPAFTTAKLLVKDFALKGIIPIQLMRAVSISREDKSVYATSSFDYDMSDLSKFIFKRVKLNEMIAKRRENYQHWLKNIHYLQTFAVLFSELYDGIVPYSFPVIVENRDTLLQKLKAKGVLLEPTLNPPFYALPNLLNGNEQFADVEFLAERFLSLPVYQSINTKIIDKLIDIIHKIL